MEQREKMNAIEISQFLALLPKRALWTWAGDGQDVLGFMGKEVESILLPLPIQNPEFRMPKCVVRLRDTLDIQHSVVVYAESLYEAVVRGLNQLSEVGWESHADETIKQVEVEIYQEPTRHVVDVPKLLKWINQNAMSPRQQTLKEKLRTLLGAR